MLLSEKERNELYNLYYELATIRQVRQLFLNRIFASSLTLRSDLDEERKPTREFQIVLDQYYTAFAKSLLDDFFILGYSHFFIKKVTLENGQKFAIPAKLEFGSYTVKVDYEPFKDYNIEFIPNTEENNLIQAFFKLKKAKTDSKTTTTSKRHPKIYPIIFEQNILPDLKTGKHRSIVATLFKPNQYLMMLKKLNLQRQYISAYPKLLLKQEETKNTNVASQKFNNETLLDNEIIELRQRRSNALALESANQMDECQQMDKMRKTVLFEGEVIELNDVNQNMFVLPKNLDLATPLQQNLNIQNDVIEFEIQRNRLVLETFGVPSSLIAGRDMSLKRNGTSNSDELLFFKSILGYTKIIQTALQQVYNQIYPDNLNEYIVILLDNDSINMDMIVRLAEENAISEEEKKRLLLVRAGLI